jgi:hypothetical protein
LEDIQWCEHPLRVKGSRVIVPSLDSLRVNGRPLARAGEIKAFLETDETEVMSLVEWIKDTMESRCRVLGIWSWEEMEFRVVRQFKGMVIYFDDSTDAVHFRLMWNDICRDHVPSQGR